MTWKPGDPISAWQDAQLFARWHMADLLGYVDSRLTPSGTDEGLDVVSSSSAAQVKFERARVGRPALQKLVGAVGQAVEVQLVFYSLSGFTVPATEYANRHGVALFHLDRNGDAACVNAVARAICASASGRRARARRLAGRPNDWGTVAASLFLILCPVPVAISDRSHFTLALVGLSTLLFPFCCWLLVSMRSIVKRDPSTADAASPIYELLWPKRDITGRRRYTPPRRVADRSLSLRITRPVAEPAVIILTTKLRIPRPLAASARFARRQLRTRA